MRGTSGQTAGAAHADAVRIGVFRGSVAPAFDGDQARAQLARMRELALEPGRIVLAEGRNRNVRVPLAYPGGVLQTVVKAFGNDGAVKERLRRARGSKARRTWQAACALRDAGVGTPDPVAFLERREHGRLVESYFISVFQDGVSSFKDELIRLFRLDPNCHKFMALLQTVAAAIRRMHDAGIQHNDLGNQNILIRRTAEAQWADVQFIDLNRARQRDSMTPRQRGRDLSRIYLPSDFLRVFLEMYWGAEPPPRELLYWECRYRRQYAVHTATRRYRHPLRTWRGRAGSEARYPDEKDMWVWDERSGQAVATLRPHDRAAITPLSRNLSPALATLRHAVPVLRAYRGLRAEAYRNPVVMKDRVGVAVSPAPATLQRLEGLLDGLGRPPVLVRFYHHETQREWDFCADAVRRLHGRGHRMAAALVQDRRAVKEPERWSAFTGHVVDAIADCVDSIEWGHAINRVKWGIWDTADLRGLLAPLPALCARHPTVTFTGPAAIDFEYPCVLGALDAMPAGARFGGLSHHLYVDRRGAPENPQSGHFATLEKCALARAIARASARCGDRLIVSEVNWPLTGTGVYSPVGSPYESPGPRYNDPSVSEDDYADFMLRYLLIAICSGMAERVYWWQLVAHGYGLVDDRDPAGWRERPAYTALQNFLQTVSPATFVGLLEPVTGDAECLLFQRADGARICVCYAMQPGCVTIPFTAARATDALGSPVRMVRDGDLMRLDLGGRPVVLEGGA